MIKNPSPNTIASFTTALLSVIFIGFLLYFKVPLLEFLISVFSFASLTFIIILFGLEIFIYRKIKIIYKTIHTLKKSKFDKNLNLDLEKDPIKKVNEQVLEWANDQKNEMALLHANEEYRKEFLGNISHELKTPIFSIQGYVETLLDGAINDNEVNMQFLQKIANNADRLNILVKDLLDISKLESSSSSIEYSEFDVFELTKEIFETNLSHALKRNINLSIKEGCDHSFFVIADKNKINQVLTNLIINAIYYGKENGNVIVSFYDMHDNTLIEVSDDGEGIEEEHLPRLFERFYRTDKSRARHKGGTGLGLAIVKHIIEAHNQTINVRSSIGVGTTFGFTLKAKK